MQSKPNILLIYTGGTIGMMKDFETGALKAFNFSKLISKIPELNYSEPAAKTDFEAFKTVLNSRRSIRVRTSYTCFSSLPSLLPTANPLP